MTHHSVLWDAIQRILRRDQWMELSEIYDRVASLVQLDDEDFQPQSPTSNIPKWKRNVRNVLQYRKRTREVLWNGKAAYRLP